MPVPDSGQLRLRADIALEVDGSDTGTNVSLGTLSNTAGFTEPDTMSEFYGYSSFTAPTITANVSFSSVSSSGMTVSFSYANTGGANLESGFYFGTSTNMTSNTFYSEGNSTSTSRSPGRAFTGLSGSTTYYCWGVVRDTESPARFTELATTMGTQATSQPTLPSFTTQNVQVANSEDRTNQYIGCNNHGFGGHFNDDLEGNIVNPGSDFARSGLTITIYPTHPYNSTTIIGDTAQYEGNYNNKETFTSGTIVGGGYNLYRNQMSQTDLNFVYIPFTNTSLNPSYTGGISGYFKFSKSGYANRFTLATFVAYGGTDEC